jgi:CheY-like chemotaxis protein
VGYRIETGGTSLVYATDHEPHATQLWRPDRPEGLFDTGAMLHSLDSRHAEFLRDADLVIHDAQYTAAEYYPTKVGWGHSTVEYVVDVALAAGVKQLVLFHHDPLRTDEDVDELLAACRTRVTAGAALEIIAAAEGQELSLAEGARKQEVQLGPRTPRVPTRARILIADDDEVVLGMLEAALRLDGYDVMKATDGVEAVSLAGRYQFDLILLDVEMPEMDGLTACRTLRANSQFDSVPIVMLTARKEPEDIAAGFAEGVTDYMTKPFAMPLVRARVRSWLTRAASGSG